MTFDVTGEADYSVLDCNLNEVANKVGFVVSGVKTFLAPRFVMPIQSTSGGVWDENIFTYLKWLYLLIN